jgi:acyl-CoA reductase-like NAD-dependent aldehyde dehydrogenase
VKHPVDAHLETAQAAIAAMRDAALAARFVHARAELLRHMRTTARKMVGRPVDEAARLVCGEWMKAWSLDAGAYPALAGDITRFAAAFCTDAGGSTPSTCAEIDASLAALERGFEKIGTTLSDQMAMRSECAHGWWSAVVPKPDGADAAPFWERGCPPHCR